jgi:hypothetical protein
MLAFAQAIQEPSSFDECDNWQLSLAICERHSRYPTIRGYFTHASRKDTDKVIAWLEMEYVPKDYTPEQMDELEELIDLSGSNAINTDCGGENPPENSSLLSIEVSIIAGYRSGCQFLSHQGTEECQQVKSSRLWRA